MTDSESWSVLDDISPELKKYLNIRNLTPLFRSKRLLTESELERIEISAHNPTSQAVERLIAILKRKEPTPEKFLEVLRLSLEDDDFHLGHQYLYEQLKDAMAREEEQKSASYISLTGNSL